MLTNQDLRGVLTASDRVQLWPAGTDAPTDGMATYTVAAAPVAPAAARPARSPSPVPVPTRPSREVKFPEALPPGAFVDLVVYDDGGFRRLLSSFTACMT